jgi:hypothetical protein
MRSLQLISETHFARYLGDGRESKQFVDYIKLPLQDTELYRVRGISGVEWAMPMYKGF